jgi:hypothetical protein
MVEYDKNPIDIDQLYKICKTGDIIYFRWPYPDIGFRLFSKFSHVGMVYRKGKNVYILETHPEGDASELGVDESGVHLYDLKERVEKYTGICYLSKLNIDSCVLRESGSDSLNVHKFVENELDKYKKIPFDEDFRYNYVMAYLHHLIGKTRKNDKMYCSTFIGFILKDLKLLDDNYNIEVFSPSSFLHLKKEDTFLYDYHLKKIVVEDTYEDTHEDV